MIKIMNLRKLGKQDFMDILDAYRGNSHALHAFLVACFDQKNHCTY